MWNRLRVISVVAAVAASITGAALVEAAGTGDVVGVVTEIRKAQGDVRVKGNGDGDWKPVKPLMSLRAGDQVRAEGDARAVILITGGGAKAVTEKDSPFTVTPLAADGGAGAKGVVTNVAKFLAHKQDAPTYLKLTSRRVPNPKTPMIMSPRETRLLHAPVTFVWNGSDELKYAIEVIGPEGRLWSESGLSRGSIKYPDTAPPLRQGVRYQWILNASGYPPIRTWFEIGSEAQVSRLQSELAQIDPKEYSGTTIALLRAGVLFGDRFYKDALDELQENAQAFKDEPTLRFMAGHVYDQIGLRYLAEQSFDQAAALTGQK